MDVRQFHARLNAAAKAFKLAGGKHPRVKVSGDTIEIIEAPPNSTDSDQSAIDHALIVDRLGASRSAK